MLNSNYQKLCAVQLPYANRQSYMHSFDLSAPKMQIGFDDYLDPVMALCNAAGATSGIAHMTVDEQIVRAGMSQRRPRPHVDGCFVPKLMDWSHGPGPSWLHVCNDIGSGPIRRMAVIVAASAIGCKAWRGTFDGEPASDGDLTHIANQLDEGEILPANIGFLLSPDCVHESMRFERDTKRTFLRIALPTTFRA